MEGPRVSVLVVDDEPPIVELIQRTLESLGLSVDTAGSAEQALLRAADRRPDLVVLDLMLPGVDGEQLGSELRRLCGDDLPILLLSASKEVRSAAYRLGAYSALDKPFDLERLEIEVLRGLTSRRESVYPPLGASSAADAASSAEPSLD